MEQALNNDKNNNGIKIGAKQILLGKLMSQIVVAVAV